MFRSDVENITGLTRKAIEYYEEKEIISPKRLENDYRVYTKEDIEILKLVSIYRKLGLSVNDIKKILRKESNIGELIRYRELKVDVEKRKNTILKELLSGKDIDKIRLDIKNLEKEESIYERLSYIFPGYFGQLFFYNYKPFLLDRLDENGEKYFKEFISFIDSLPAFNLRDKEINYIESMTKNIRKDDLEKISKDKIYNIDNYEKWYEENKENILEYMSFKDSEEYKKSIAYSIEVKLKKYMEDTKYYEFAIPLIRKFSPSYNKYYENLLVANEFLEDKIY